MPSVGRDPFARGEYDRKCCGPGNCEWCGTHRKRLFTYVWVNDDNNRGVDHVHARAKAFCDFSCFNSYYD